MTEQNNQAAQVIAARLRACREAKGWAMAAAAEQLSEAAGESVSLQRWAYWEGGGRVPARGLDWLVDRMTVAPGTKLYTAPPASPDVEGLVKALEEVRGYTDSPHVVGVIDNALSTWRQAQESEPCKK